MASRTGVLLRAACQSSHKPAEEEKPSEARVVNLYGSAKIANVSTARLGETGEIEFDLKDFRNRPRHPSLLRAWLAGITRNLARNVHRSDRRRTDREQLAARPEGLPATEDTATRRAGAGPVRHRQGRPTMCAESSRCARLLPSRRRRRRVASR